MEGNKQPNYIAVWVGLAVLTGIEIGVAFVGLPRTLTIWTLVLLAVWKAMLVALYYMHLRFERLRLIVLAAVPLPLAFIFVLAVLVEYAR